MTRKKHNVKAMSCVYIRCRHYLPVMPGWLILYECMTAKFLNMSVCRDDMLFMTLLDTMMYVDGAYNERTAIYYK